MRVNKEDAVTMTGPCYKHENEHVVGPMSDHVNCMAHTSSEAMI